MSRPVFITAGGTGGHMFPAMALAQELRARGQAVRMLTDRRGARYLNDDLPRDVIRAGSPSGNWIRKLRGLALLSIGTLQSWLLMGRVKPIAATCFGGYASIPGAFAAMLRRVPILVHEQNAVFGWANRVIAKKSRAIALSFEDTKAVPKGLVAKVLVSGNPVRPGFSVGNASDAAGDRIAILVLGGSQGARVLSDAVPGALAGLSEAMKARIRVEQQCRPEDLDRVKDAYAGTGIEVELARFFNDVPERMARAQLLITRAGASTIAELLAAGKPSILIPFAHAAEDHQSANAQQLVKGGAAELVLERELTSDRLRSLLEQVLARPERLASMARAARAMARPDAAAVLADTVLAIAGREGRS